MMGERLKPFCLIFADGLGGVEEHIHFAEKANEAHFFEVLMSISEDHGLQWCCCDDDQGRLSLEMTTIIILKFKSLTTSSIDKWKDQNKTIQKHKRTKIILLKLKASTNLTCLCFLWCALRGLSFLMCYGWLQPGGLFIG